MDVKSVKIDLIHWLTELQDISVLEKLQGLKEAQESSFELSAEQNKELDSRLGKYETGDMKFSSWEKVKEGVIIMGAIDIKQELRTLIEKENDLHVLEAIKTLLIKSSLDPVLKEKLTSRALKAEEDIRAGSVYTREELERKLDDSPRKK
ncbi:addiction module protein [Cyclobacterium salsum]|uniref:addiction module protein n=1 Tax=Cyclobacterium salsum TaxID=2666329 RepID=UPI001F3076AA|nr:addiction module protein [Cyclobacterium salsum]